MTNFKRVMGMTNVVGGDTFLFLFGGSHTFLNLSRGRKILYLYVGDTKNFF